MKSFLWKLRFVIPLLILPVILVLIWFRNGYIIGGGDEQLLFLNTKRALDVSTSVWLKYGTGFATLVWLSRAPFLYILEFLHSTLYIPTVILQGGTFLLLMTTGVLSVYLLVLQFLDKYKYSYFIAYVAAVFYLLNPYSMSQVWGRGQYAQFFSFSLLPLSLLIFVIGITKRQYIYTIIFSFISVLFSVAYGFLPFSIAQWTVLSSYVIYEIVSGYKKKKKIDIFLIFFLILSVFFWVIIHSWWLLPLILSGPSILGVNITNTNENIGTLLGVSQSYPFPIIIRLLQTFYFFSEHSYSPYYQILRFQLISWLPVIGLIIGIVVTLKSKHFSKIRFFLIIFFIGLFVSLGANPPFGSFFVYIFERIPILQMFRNSYEKFGLVYLLGYSMLFSIGIITFSDYILRRNACNKFIIYPMVAVILIVLNIYLWPMWTGRIIAGSDGNIGLPIPSNYSSLSNWLNVYSDNYRVVLTPLWRGEGTAYKWKDVRYQGVDPFIYGIYQESIASGGRVPYYYDFYQSLLEYMQQVNTRPALELLRVKYLVDRKDAVQITSNERNQYRFLSEEIFPMSDSLKSLKCETFISRNDGILVCTVALSDMDWKDMKYLKFNGRANTSATLDVSLVDKNGNRMGWDGRGISSYHVDGISWSTHIFPLYAPTSQSEAFNSSQIASIEISAHPITKPGDKVGKLDINEIYLNEGRKESIQEYLPRTQFGSLQVFAPTSLSTPPEFGVLSANELVTDYLGLFESANQLRDRLGDTGFVIKSQNKGKDIQSILETTSAKIIEKAKVSETKYWLRISGDNDAYVILSKTYYPDWKVMPQTSKELLNGKLINNIRLLVTPSTFEDQHYVVNGYANMWKVEGKSNEYVIVFIPQIIADIGKQISILGGLCLLLLFIILKGKKVILKSYTRFTKYHDER